MDYIVRLKKNLHFKNVYKRGQSIADKYVVVYYCKNNLDETRVGFTASKKVGNSVKRNRARRLMKESFRNICDDKVKRGYDMVIIARVAIKDAEYAAVERSMKRVMKKVKAKL